MGALTKRILIIYGFLTSELYNSGSVKKNMEELNYEEGHTGVNSILGIVLVLIVVLLVLYFFTPIFGGGAAGGSQINLPSNINVNPQ